ncbi:MAG: hypothetical protein Q8N05_08295 [Bacteroidota bacterium]|nr:hypothetical protein [Bacteroidota bacterium]
MNKQKELKYFQSRMAIALFLAFLLGGCHSKPKNLDTSMTQKTDSVGMGNKLNCCSSNLPARPFVNGGD